MTEQGRCLDSSKGQLSDITWNGRATRQHSLPLLGWYRDFLATLFFSQTLPLGSLFLFFKLFFSEHEGLHMQKNLQNCVWGSPFIDRLCRLCYFWEWGTSAFEAHKDLAGSRPFFMRAMYLHVRNLGSVLWRKKKISSATDLLRFIASLPFMKQ